MGSETKKFYYRVYGLNLESEVYIPEFTVIKNPSKENIDTTIKYKSVSKEIKENIKNGKKNSFTYNDMWFNVDNVAIYHIYNGDKVEIELYDNSDPYIVKIYILGAVLGLVLLQKNMIAIHGGAVLINDKGCVFTGDKGAGKSTLTTALRQKGYGFIADDVASINLDEEAKIHPGFGYQKICEDTMDKLGYNPIDFVPFNAGENTKYIVPALDKFIDYEVSFKALFEITVDDIDDVKIEELSGSKKLDNIIKNIFNVSVLGNAGGIPPIIFNKCIDIARNIKCYKIVRPRDKFTVDDQINLIEEVLA